MVNSYNLAGKIDKKNKINKEEKNLLHKEDSNRHGKKESTGQTISSDGTLSEETCKNATNSEIPSSNEETFKPQKNFKNPSLDSSAQENMNFSTEMLSKSMKDLKISVDEKKVLSSELLVHKDVKWEQLKVLNKIAKILKSFGYKFPSPVQYSSIPHIINGKDVLVRSKNGSGKTLSFIIPILQKIDVSKNTLQAIIMVPIRELALQIAKISRSLCKELNIKSTPLVGGSDLSDDIIRVSSGVHLLIGTPGRILDLLDRNLCTIENNPLIVFDEADKLLDSTFFEPIYRLLTLLPTKKQICLYSATFPVSTKSFVNLHMKQPELIQISREYTLFNISSFYAKVTLKTKVPCLKSLLNTLNINQCIIYCNKIENVQNLAQKITEMGLSCYFIHSNMSQDERNIVFHNFSKNKCKILVSTDLTTRGTDVQGVNVVINFDLPLSSESFLHRHGRAGRFGVKGCCVSLIHESEVENMENFSNFVGNPVLPCSDSSFKDFCKN